MITLLQAQQWYTQADPVHNFDHIQRVYNMARRIGIAEQADIEIVLAAALLHDADGNDLTDKAKRKDHHLASADFAERILLEDGWSEERIKAVQHSIQAHRYRDNSVQPETIEAQVLFDADKLDSIGAVGVARVLAYSAIAKMPFYAQPSAKFLATGEKEPGEPHSAYHEHLFKLRKIKDRLFTKTGKAIAAERHVTLDRYFLKLIEEWNSIS